jgi:hypothetical protein
VTASRAPSEAFSAALYPALVLKKLTVPPFYVLLHVHE